MANSEGNQRNSQSAGEDEFRYLIKLCQPTASQEAVESPTCSLDCEKYPLSSLDPTPSLTSPIVMISPPGSSSSVQAQGEAEYHTPPQHLPQPHLSSSEEMETDCERIRAIKLKDSENVGGSSKAIDDSKGKRQLPVSIEGKEVEVDTIMATDGGEEKKKETIMDYMDVLRAIFGNSNDVGKEVDLYETAKKQGLKFPKPRWKD